MSPVRLGYEFMPSPCGYPIADLAAVLVLQHAAVGLDHLAGGDVVLIAGEQSPGDTERPGNRKGGGMGHRPDTKRAIVTLAPGDSIDLFEN